MRSVRGQIRGLAENQSWNEVSELVNARVDTLGWFYIKSPVRDLIRNQVNDNIWNHVKNKMR